VSIKHLSTFKDLKDISRGTPQMNDHGGGGKHSITRTEFNSYFAKSKILKLHDPYQQKLKLDNPDRH
jgi:hypothetical protein